MGKCGIRTIDCGIVAMAALGYGSPWLWRAVTRLWATRCCYATRHSATAR